MSKLHRLIVVSMPGLLGLLMIFCISTQLSTSVYHNELTKYGFPICGVDRHQFTEDTCEACGADVLDSGVFFSRDVAMANRYSDDFQVRFSDYYESYEAFIEDYNRCLYCSVQVAVIVVVEILVYIFMFFYSRRKRSTDGIKRVLHGG